MQPAMKEGICQNCGQQALIIKGLCGDCAPASYHRYPQDWWNSPAGQLERTILAEQLLAEFAFEQGEAADQLLQHEQADNGAGSGRAENSLYDGHTVQALGDGVNVGLRPNPEDLYPVVERYCLVGCGQPQSRCNRRKRGKER